MLNMILKKDGPQAVYTIYNKTTGHFEVETLQKAIYFNYVFRDRNSN